MMSDYLTDEVVERAAQIIDSDAFLDPELFTLEYGGYPSWSSESQSARKRRARSQARAALEAVAPLIAAKAWEEGYQACRNRPRVDGYLINRANPYQTRADRIERGES